MAFCKWSQLLKSLYKVCIQCKSVCILCVLDATQWTGLIDPSWPVTTRWPPERRRGGGAGVLYFSIYNWEKSSRSTTLSCVVFPVLYEDSSTETKMSSSLVNRIFNYLAFFTFIVFVLYVVLPLQRGPLFNKAPSGGIYSVVLRLNTNHYLI